MIAFIRRHPLAVGYLISGLILVFVVHGLDDQVKGRCRDSNKARQVVRELVEVATNNPQSALSPDQIESIPQFKALDKPNQDFWLFILSASQGNGPSANQRLKDFADKNLQPLNC